MGLAITKQLIELMQGSVHLDSEKGKGSSFSFSVRMRVAQKAKEEQQAAEQFEFINQNQEMPQLDSVEKFFQFGTTENVQEIRGKMEKLILCMEVEAWDKAENFAHNIKELMEQAPRELKRSAFRLEMNVRKSDHDKSMEQYNNLKALFEETVGGM